jgi:hypothetical protein
MGRVVGGAGVVGAAYYQPMALGGVAALALLLIVGVVFPAVWSRNAARRRAAATVLRLLLTALVGPRIATAATPPAEQEERRKQPMADGLRVVTGKHEFACSSGVEGGEARVGLSGGPRSAQAAGTAKQLAPSSPEELSP